MSGKLSGLALATHMPSTTAKLVLIGLCDAAQKDGSSCFPSVARLAEAAQCTDRAVQNWLKQFRETVFRGGRRLITVVRPGGGGPGSMTEYQIDVALLTELERLSDRPDRDAPRVAGLVLGWDALIETAAEGANAPPFAKGEAGSPLDKGEAGEAKGEPGSVKGEPAGAPDPSLDPSIRPREGAGAREGQDQGRPIDGDGATAAADRGAGGTAATGKGGGHMTPAEALEAFRKVFPDFALQSQGMASSALSALTPAERQASVDRFPDFLAFHRAKMGKKDLPYLHIYIAERRWRDLPKRSTPAGATAGATAFAAAFSQAWWWLFHHMVASSPEAFKNRDSPEAQALRKRVSLAIGNAIGWSLAADELARVEAAAKQLVWAPIDGDVVKRWQSHYGALGVPMPLPDRAKGIFVPAEVPAGEGTT